MFLHQLFVASTLYTLTLNMNWAGEKLKLSLLMICMFNDDEEKGAGTKVLR